MPFVGHGHMENEVVKKEGVKKEDENMVGGKKEDEPAAAEKADKQQPLVKGLNLWPITSPKKKEAQKSMAWESEEDEPPAKKSKEASSTSSR